MLPGRREARLGLEHGGQRVQRHHRRQQRRPAAAPCAPRPSHSSEAKTATSRAAPTRVAAGSTEISPSPLIRSRSASPRPRSGSQNSAARRPADSRDHTDAGWAAPVRHDSGGTAGSAASTVRASGTALRRRLGTSNGASTSASAGPRTTRSPASAPRPAAQLRLAAPRSAGRVRAYRGRPVGGVPGPGRTSGRRSRWSKSTWTARREGVLVERPAGPAPVPVRGRDLARPQVGEVTVGAAPSGTSAPAHPDVRYSRARRSRRSPPGAEISATPAPVSPIRGSSSSVSPSTRTHNRPCSQASPEVRLCARSTAKYVSMTTRSSRADREPAQQRRRRVRVPRAEHAEDPRRAEEQEAGRPAA